MRKLSGFILFLPLVELVLLIAMGAAMGFLTTLLWIVATGVWGAWLMRTAGPNAMARAQREMASTGRGEIDSLGVAANFVGGLMLLLPGPMTDVLGLVLVTPFLRRLAFGAWLAGRLQQVVVERGGFGPGRGPFGPGGPGGDGNVYDADPDDVSRRDSHSSRHLDHDDRD
ncbi:FxsA family protein [Guyparkeria hydrothermalis]|uniref:FxsA family protein n=1 Tax=Guyparkeria hydrothermalis TaxID=923 RepID=UPI0020223D59|nr:FxsA family protein [Guyparkeria hydrothermalis]MCL7745449.1 FxsA family protein [Guyparkeria hydrothermalis]